MITFFQDYDTDEVLLAPDMDITPNKGERVIIDKVWYIVVERTFHLDNPFCTIYVKKE